MNLDHPHRPSRAAARGLTARRDGAGRSGVVGRERLDEVRAELWERHQAGAGGLEIVKAYTEAVDELIRALYHYADTGQGRRFPRLNQRIAVIARGGDRAGGT